jgi:transposase
MLENNYTNKILGLEDCQVTNVKVLDHILIILVEMDRKSHQCPSCGTYTDCIHDYRVQEVKDISFQAMETHLRIRKRRYVCPHCGKRFMESIPFLSRYQRISRRLIAQAVQSLRKVHSLSSVAKELHLSPGQLTRIFDVIDYPRPRLPEVLSIDEFRGNADGERFQCILTDVANKVVLDVLPQRNLEKLKHYFLSFKDRDRVKVVVMDMSSLFRSMARQCFPNAVIVADKFHVIRQVCWAFETVRKEEQKKFCDEGRLLFKRSRGILLKHPTKLTSEEMERVAQILACSKPIRVAYRLRLHFEMMMRSNSRTEARQMLKQWILEAQYEGLAPFEKCARMAINWSEEILSYFDHPYTNGFTEGTNNKIKVIKRNAFGFKRFRYFRNRILHACS